MLGADKDGGSWNFGFFLSLIKPTPVPFGHVGTSSGSRCLLIYLDLSDLRSGCAAMKEQEKGCIKQHEDGPKLSQMF